jgi:hypothetical protein
MVGEFNIVLGITMLKVSPGQEAEAHRRLKDMENVKEVYRISGEFHLFVILQTKDKTVLFRLVDAIKEMPFVTAIWNVLISKENDICNEEGMYLDWPKANSRVSIC